jgi:hypothetical protein
MKVRLTVNGKAISATLLTNGAAKDFLSLLPMTLTLEDYAATEKIATHIAIQEELNGKVVDWMEKVTDEQYQGPRDDK